ncbi:hypothetical protein DL767_000588 [Monosporascus sp. MG133]|nr:hypothetical protein DL767_000588 [Monosporascus sp. MG133]
MADSAPASQGSWLFKIPVNLSSTPWFSYSPGAMDNRSMPYGDLPADPGGNPSYAPVGNNFYDFTRGLFLPQGHGGNNSSTVSYSLSNFANILIGFSETYSGSHFLNHDTIASVAHPDNAAEQVHGKDPSNSCDNLYFAQVSHNVRPNTQWPTDPPVSESATEVSRNLAADASQDVIGSALGVSEVFNMNGAMDVTLAHQHHIFQKPGDNGIPSLPMDQIVQNQVVQGQGVHNQTIQSQAVQGQTSNTHPVSVDNIPTSVASKDNLTWFDFGASPAPVDDDPTSAAFMLMLREKCLAYSAAEPELPNFGDYPLVTTECIMLEQQVPWHLSGIVTKMHGPL